MPNWTDDFLIDLDPGRWSAPEGFPKSMSPAGFFTQPGANGLEVVLASSQAKPTVADLRKGWDARRAKRASPVLLVVGYPEGSSTCVAACGPVGEQPPVHHGLGVSQAERLAATALGEPNHHAATRFLLATLPELDSPTPGLRNVGLLATQELRAGVPTRPDWPAAQGKATGLLAKRGKDLVQGLGFGVDTLGTNASMLTVAGGQRAVAVFLDEGETFDAPAGRFGTSPVSHALAIADQQNVPWVILTRSSEIRLYAARPDTGVGRKGRAETFVEANLSLLPEDQAAYLHLLFSSEALAPKGTLEEILDRSADFAADLAVRLRERVYFETVPALAQAVARRMGPDPTESDLAHAYEQVMVILFRLLFVAYAEDKELLPYRTNSRYADHSLSRIVRRLVEDRHAGTEEHDAEAEDLWEDVTQLWRAVDKGQRAWGVPPYNGGLFSSDPAVSEAGATLAELRLTDAEFGPALAAMLIDQGPEGIGPVDFRSLSVREFGTIYEGLLESQLSVAPSDLTTDKKGNYIPATGGDDALVLAGSVYFHNRSGARKDSGSYFTKPFAVEHLLEHALEPALDDHLARLEELRDTGDDAALADAFFDFRCADIAMGSGHFLIAAVDRIEARLSAYLALNPIPAVTAELDRLRSAAYEAIGDLGDGIEIETGSLLRRQVARRCIYGVDRNHVSVELARLAVWIHTFVPGLPLSFLDHNLVHGDSLTGVGTLAEVVQALDPGADPNAPSLFRSQIEEFLSAAEKALQRLARTADASKAEVDAARAAHLDALAAVAPARELFDLVAANRAGVGTLPEAIKADTIHDLRSSPLVGEAVTDLQPLHLPSAFPEVFIRENPGFDCILGNPPWEEATVEELGFWALRFPGLKSMKPGDQKKEIAGLRAARPDLVVDYEREVAEAERVRRTLTAGPYPGMGQGDPDLYKAFCWRFWTLTRDGGAIGVVLPRSALSGAGSAPWREAVLDEGCFADVTLLLNTKQWVFEEVHPQYTVGLLSIRKGQAFAGSLALRGPFASLQSFVQGVAQKSAEFLVEEFRTWSEGAAFPLLPSTDAARVFVKLRCHPRLDGADIEREREREIRTAGGHGPSRSSTPQPTNTSSSSTSEGVRRHERQAPLGRPGGDRPMAGLQGRIVQPLGTRHRDSLREGRSGHRPRRASAQAPEAEQARSVSLQRVPPRVGRGPGDAPLPSTADRVSGRNESSQQENGHCVPGAGADRHHQPGALPTLRCRRRTGRGLLARSSVLDASGLVLTSHRRETPQLLPLQRAAGAPAQPRGPHPAAGRADRRAARGGGRALHGMGVGRWRARRIGLL
ncbi:MAG: hypothetical protein H6519_10740 [Microthrixaceae bacterium]|nr:hypothetical protein [Microthrixaceae bacterium]